MQNITSASIELWPSMSSALSSPWRTLRHHQPSAQPQNSRSKNHNASATQGLPEGEHPVVSSEQYSLLEGGRSQLWPQCTQALPECLGTIPLVALRFKPTKAVLESQRGSQGLFTSGMACSVHLMFEIPNGCSKSKCTPVCQSSRWTAGDSDSDDSTILYCPTIWVCTTISYTAVQQSDNLTTEKPVWRKLVPEPPRSYGADGQQQSNKCNGAERILLCSPTCKYAGYRR